MSKTTQPTRLDRILAGSIICEIINPSDAYTLRTDDFQLAAVAIAVLGGGAFGLAEIGGDEKRTPALFGWEEWLDEESIDVEKYLKERGADLADVLDSVLIGQDRSEAEMTAKNIPPEKLDKWLADRHDMKRSSMNDIGSAAWDLAARLRDDGQ